MQGTTTLSFQYPIVSLRPSRSCLRRLPLLTVTSILPSSLPSITCFRRQFLRQMLPIQLAFGLFILCISYHMSIVFFYVIRRVLLFSTVAISVFEQFFSNLLPLRVLVQTFSLTPCSQTHHLCSLMVRDQASHSYKRGKMQVCVFQCLRCQITDPKTKDSEQSGSKHSSG